MMGRILCKLGLHRWDFMDVPGWEVDGPLMYSVERTYGRCKREGCDLSDRWHAINIERRRLW